MTLGGDVAAPGTLADDSRARIDERGVLVRDRGTGPLVLHVDGHYVWSLAPERDGRPDGEGLLVPWPDQLRRFLDGRARITLSDVAGDDVLYDAEVALGSGEGRIEVVDGEGYPLSIDKVGHLARSFAATDEAIREEILLGTQRALTDLTEGCGVEAYLNYGALLGAVRDGAMIAHDSDTDVCYVSRTDSPADLILQSYRIERELRARGWNLLRMSGGDLKLLLPLSDGRECHIDIFVAFWVDGTFYQLGNRSGRLPEEVIVPLSTITLHGHDFPAPADPEAMLAFLYGENWRVPDPSFAYADPPAGVRRLDGWLRGFRSEMGLWTELYKSPERQRISRRPSTFARWVDAQVPAREAIADLGSGTGRDSMYFAGRRRHVTAFDFSRIVRTRLERVAEIRGLDIDARLLILGELRSALLAGAELARDPHHLYARELLGCLDAAARANLWRLAGMALRGGGSMFLQFSAADPDRAGQLPVPGPRGLVRRVDPDLVAREIAAAGGEVTLVELGPGEDMYDEPDPLVCRMRVTWPRPQKRSPR